MKTILTFALACLSVTAFAQEGVVKDPSGQEWKVAVAKAPGGESVSLSRVVGGKAKFLTTVWPSEKASMIQELDRGISMAKTAASQKTPGPLKTPVAGKHNVALEVDAQGGAGVVFGRTKLSIDEAIGLRDCLSRLDGYVAQVKR